MGYERLKQRLAAGETIILDGPTGTELQRRGAPMDPGAWCGPATLSHERLLTEIHADYIAAGADIITANTFASSRLMLARSGLGHSVRETMSAPSERHCAPAIRPRTLPASLSRARCRTWCRSDKALPSQAEVEDAFHELGGIPADAGETLCRRRGSVNPWVAHAGRGESRPFS
jgi:hypothetical protein